MGNRRSSVVEEFAVGEMVEVGQSFVDIASAVGMPILTTKRVYENYRKRMAVIYGGASLISHIAMNNDSYQGVFNSMRYSGLLLSIDRPHHDVLSMFKKFSKVGEARMRVLRRSIVALGREGEDKWIW